MIDSKNSSANPAPMWHALSDPMETPDASMMPPLDKPSLAADDLLKRGVDGAHTTIDRVADSIAPTVRQLGESIASAEDALQARTEQLRETREQWSATLRSAVRKHPLQSLAGALVVGVLIARIAR